MKKRKRSKASLRVDPRQLPKIALLGLGAVVLGWTVFKTAAVNALYRDNPAAALALAPDDPRFAFKIAMAQVMQNRGRVDPQTAAAAQRAMAADPLAEQPFLVESLKALARGEDARAERLLSEARARNPRSRTARLILLDRYMRSGRIADAAEEITVLSRLIPAATSILVPELSKFARDPKTRPALIKVLRSDPLLGENVLAHLAKAGTDPQLVTNLAAQVPARSGTARPWQGALVESLVARGDLTRAYSIWSSLPGVRPAEGAVYDPRFDGLPGPPPFNWKLSAGNFGVAERGQNGGLQVEYYGRVPAGLASQLIRLPPGRYRLAARVEGDAKGEAARLAWRVVCRGSNAELAGVALRGVNYSPKVVAAEFTVPAGCSVQSLQLDGIPSEFAETQSATIDEISIREVEAK